MTTEEKDQGKASDSSIELIESIIKKCDKVYREDISYTGMDHYFDLQFVSDKSIADCVESVLGTYLLVRKFRNTFYRYLETNKRKHFYLTFLWFASKVSQNYR